MKNFRLWCQLVGLVILNGGFVLFANAAVFEVTPVQLFLSTQQPIGVLKITNESDEKSLLQLNLVSWQQRAGENIYQPSQDILLTPPIFKLPPHCSQVIRFALRRPTFGYIQKTYRVEIKEIDQGHPRKETGQKLYFLMNFSVPLFVQPKHQIEQAVWSIKPLADNKIKLHLINEGNITLFINNWRLMNSQKNLELAKQNTFTYILPHQSYDWTVSMNKKEKINQIVVKINGVTKKINIAEQTQRLKKI